MIDTAALRTRLLKESQTQRDASREMAADALATPGLTDASREYFTAVLSILDNLTPTATSDAPSTDQAARRRSGGAHGANQYGAYTVRYASDKQAAYLRHLFATRDTSVKKGPILATLNRAARELESGSIALRLASDAIDALLTCPVADHPTAAAEIDRLTERQEAFLTTLVKDRDTTSLTLPDDLSTLTRSEASALINTLKALPRRSTTPTHTPDVTEGMYVVPGVGIVKVQKSRESGRLYGKVLSEDDNTFSFAPGVLRKVRPEHKMTLEAAQAYGKLYGTCCVCGRTLTDETSISNGIGPVCASKTEWA